MGSYRSQRPSEQSNANIWSRKSKVHSEIAVEQWQIYGFKVILLVKQLPEACGNHGHAYIAWAKKGVGVSGGNGVWPLQHLHCGRGSP